MIQVRNVKFTLSQHNSRRFLCTHQLVYIFFCIITAATSPNTHKEPWMEQLNVFMSSFAWLRLRSGVCIMWDRDWVCELCFLVTTWGGAHVFLWFWDCFCCMDGCSYKYCPGHEICSYLSTAHSSALISVIVMMSFLLSMTGISNWVPWFSLRLTLATLNYRLSIKMRPLKDNVQHAHIRTQSISSRNQ